MLRKKIVVVPEIFDTWLLVMLRVTAIILVVPIFSSRGIPVKIRMALAGFTAAAITPTIPPISLESLPFIQVILVMSLEVLCGLLLGFVARIFFYGLDLAGALIATQMGLMMSNDINPYQQEQASLPSLILYHLAVFLFFSLNLHHWFFMGVYQSYDSVPVGAGMVTEALIDNLIQWTGGIFLVGVQIAGPIVAISFILLLTFSFLGRAVPQMNVFSESFSVRIIVGLLTLGTSCELMSKQIADYLRGIPTDMFKAINLFR